MGITLGHDEWIDLLWRIAHEEENKAYEYKIKEDSMPTPEARIVMCAYKEYYQKRCVAIEDAIHHIQSCENNQHKK